MGGRQELLCLKKDPGWEVTNKEPSENQSGRGQQGQRARSVGEKGQKENQYFSEVHREE